MNELDKLAEAFKDHAESDERNFAEIKKGIEEIKVALTPLTEAYSGILFSRKFLTGLAAIVLALGAIGGGVYWIIDSVKNRP